MTEARDVVGEIIILPEITELYEELYAPNVVEIHYDNRVETFDVYAKDVEAGGAEIICLSRCNVIKRMAPPYHAAIIAHTTGHEFKIVNENGWITVSKSIRVFLVSKN